MTELIQEVVDITSKPLSEVYWKDYMAHKYPAVPIFETDDKNRLTESAAIKLRDFSAEKVQTMCDVCKEGQIREHGKIVIKCNGLASIKQEIPEDILHKFDQEELDSLEEIVNPYSWADNHIDTEALPHKRMFSPRWYQEQMVRCTATRKVYRCGRRTGKTYSFALNILHRVLTNDAYKVLIVTPFEVQAEELINQIRDFTYKLDSEFGTYKDLVIKDVKSPSYNMQFSNKSRIRGFTTGSSGAGSVRGQSADLIVLDEVDYMSEADFAGIVAILADNPDTEMWVASTPSGKKALHRLEQNKNYKSFHFPTFVLPHYNDRLDEDFKEQLTDVGYIQEIMAEFGASEAGVFQHYFIDKCIHPEMSNAQRNDVLKNRSKYIVILGCDWNDDKVGTRILCVAFDKQNHKFFVAEKEKVSKEGWSQVEAVNKIIELNRRYKFDHMYVDEGFGTSQIQFIKQYAIDQFGKLPTGHADLNLADIVGINFSSKIDTRDVYTGEEIKKDMKTYMVENCARYLEKQLFLFDESFDKDLMDQMGNYIIKGRSPTGKPTYCAEEEKIGDHDLDAFMLAILGFSMEYSEFLNIKVSDSLINLVPRADMAIGSNPEDNDPFNENPDVLFANMNANSPKDLYHRKISRYNRSTLGSSRSDFGGHNNAFNSIPTLNSEGYLESTISSRGLNIKYGASRNGRSRF